MTESSTTYKQLNPLNKQNGLTLLELTIVLLIMMVLAGLVLPTFNEVPAYAQCTATKSTMKAIRDALLGDIAGGGYVDDMGSFPVSLNALLQSNYCSDRNYTNKKTCVAASETWQAEDIFSPVTGRGWRGSYLQESTIITVDNLAATTSYLTSTAYTNSIIVGVDPSTSPPITADLAESSILDSFSQGTAVPPLEPARRPIILQNPKNTPAIPPDVNTDCAPPTSGAVSSITYVLPAVPDASNIPDCIRLVSAGQNGILDTKLSDAAGAYRGDDLVLYLKISDPTAIAPKDDQTGCSLTD